ncbi:hypothetical protein BN2537_3955 [Streptomyces venezuelae]|nr:hypothetical protein BN2537_3955 [Streptomyces venezuelae]
MARRLAVRIGSALARLHVRKQGMQGDGRSSNSRRSRARGG